jgi:putative ABC transport system substrate-binding protein
VYRVGVLRPGARPAQASDITLSGFSQALRDLGYAEDRNLVIVYRFAEGRTERLSALAQSLLQESVDVIVAVGIAAARAAAQATTTLPIILFGNADPVAAGLVSNLARPGANLTGILIAPDGTLAPKRLEMLRAVVPQATRIALLAPDDPAFENQLQESLKAATATGLPMSPVVVRSFDYAKAFETIVAQRSDALVVGAHQYFTRDRQRIIALAAQHRLPAIYEWGEQVHDGGLMSYGTSLLGRYRRVALQVDRVMNGASAGDLPIELPEGLHLVINLRTAAALKLAIPQSLLLRADEVIR